MARQATAGDGNPGPNEDFDITISGSDRLTLVAYAILNSFSLDVLDTLDYGTSNTVYDLGVDETVKDSEILDYASNQDAEFFVIFDGDHPANGTVTCTFTNSGSGSGGVLGLMAQYDAADQTTGYRGTAVTVDVDTGTAWDLTSISEDSGDMETMGFALSRSDDTTHAPDADNPEVLSETYGGTGGGAPVGVIVADTTSRADLGGDFAVNSRGFGCWGASILNAAADTSFPPFQPRHYSPLLRM